MTKKSSEGAKTLAVIGLIVLVVIVGILLFKGDVKQNPFENKKIISMNTTCTKVQEAAEVLSQIYNVPVGKVIIAECNKACNDRNLTLNDWKCTSNDEFICYCNEIQ